MRQYSSSSVAIGSRKCAFYRWTSFFSEYGLGRDYSPLALLTSTLRCSVLAKLNNGIYIFAEAALEEHILGETICHF